MPWLTFPNATLKEKGKESSWTLPSGWFVQGQLSLNNELRLWCKHHNVSCKVTISNQIKKKKNVLRWRWIVMINQDLVSCTFTIKYYCVWVRHFSWMFLKDEFFCNYFTGNCLSLVCQQWKTIFVSQIKSMEGKYIFFVKVLWTPIFLVSCIELWYPVNGLTYSVDGLWSVIYLFFKIFLYR